MSIKQQSNNITTMAKVIYPNRIDGKFCSCPFLGFTISNIEDFINVIKKYYNKETGYPGLYFNLNNGVKLVFSGHQYEHGEEGRWCYFTQSDNKPHNWFKLKDHFDEVFNLFEDKEKQLKDIKIISNICKQNNGITINI